MNCLFSNGVDTCEVAQCRFDDGCWRPLRPYQHSGWVRAAMWARVLLTQWRRAVGSAREHVEAGARRGTEVPKIIIVSDAVRGTKVNLDGKCLQVEQIVEKPVPFPQFRVETVAVLGLAPRERVQQRSPQYPEETVEAVTSVTHERVQTDCRKMAKYRRRQAKTGVCSVQWSRPSWIVPRLKIAVCCF